MASEDEARARWLAERRSGIGGSDAPAVMGVSKWRSPYAVWAAKAGVQEDREDNAVLIWGRRFEAPIAEEYTAITGRKLRDLGAFTVQRHPERPWMLATHDRIIEPIDDRGPGVLSVKFVGPFAKDAWAAGEVPVDYQVQLAHEMEVSGLKWGSFAVFVWGVGVVWQDTDRNANFTEALVDVEHDFWKRVQSLDPPPADESDSTHEALRRMYPQSSNREVELPPQALDWALEVRGLEAEIKKLGAKVDLRKNEIKRLLGDADVGTIDGRAICTWRSHETSGYTVAPGVQRPFKFTLKKEKAR